MSSAAPAACTSRKPTSMPTLVEAAQAAEAAVKIGDAEQKAPVEAVTVGHPPEEDQQRGVDDGVAVEHPGQLAQVGRLEVSGDLGQRHVDDEQVEAGEDHPGAHDDQHLAGGCLGACRGERLSDAPGLGCEFRHRTHSTGLHSIMQPTMLDRMERKSFADMHCSVAQCLEVVGEWWSMLIVRDVFMGVTRFDAFQERLGISRNILNQRLTSPCRDGRAQKGPLQRAPAQLRLPADRQGP